jgi:hypothetical protein
MVIHAIRIACCTSREPLPQWFRVCMVNPIGHRESKGRRSWRRTSSGRLTAPRGNRSSRCDTSLPQLPMTRTSPRLRTTVMRLRRAIPVSPREGTLDLVQMLPAVDGARQRPRPYRQNRLNDRYGQGLRFVVDGLSRHNHRVPDLGGSDGAPPG